MASAPDSLDAALATLVHEELGRPLGAFVASLAALVARLTTEGAAAHAPRRVARTRPVPRVQRVVRARGPAVGGLEVAPAFREVPSAIPTARVWVRRQGSLLPLPTVGPGASGVMGSE